MKLNRHNLLESMKLSRQLSLKSDLIKHVPPLRDLPGPATKRLFTFVQLQTIAADSHKSVIDGINTDLLFVSRGSLELHFQN